MFFDYNISNYTHLWDNWTYYESSEERFKSMGLTASGFGMVANVTAIVVVMRSLVITWGRKIMLMNLIIADMILLMGLCTHIQVKHLMEIQEVTCLLLVNTIVIRLILSYVVTLQLSVFNILAVYKVFCYKRVVTWQKSCLSVVLGWVLSTGLSVVCVGFDLPPTTQCSPPVVIPKDGLVVIVTTMLFTFIGIFTLNTFVAFKLKESQRYLYTFIGSAAFYKPNTLKNRQHSSGNMNTSDHGSSDIIGDTRRNMSTSESNLYHVTQTDKQSTTSSPSRKCQHSNKTMTRMSPSLQSDPQPSDTTPARNAYRCQKITASSTGHATCDMSRRSVTGSRAKQALRTTLVIIMVSCSLSLPILTYLLVKVSGVIDRSQVYSTIGRVVSLWVAIRPCLNPFVYVFSLSSLGKTANEVGLCLCPCRREAGAIRKSSVV